MKTAFTITLAVAITALSAGPASAATRYASPTGVPSLSCPQLSPCSALSAINSANNGDEVILLSGTYDVATNAAVELGSTTGTNVVIRGESPIAPPLLRIAPTNVADGFIVNNLVTLRDVRISYEGINASAYALVADPFASVDRVHVEGGPFANVACKLGIDVTMTNTACIARETGSVGGEFFYTANVPSSFDHSATVRNSTFVATGANSFGVRVVAGNSDPIESGTVRVHAFNSIFSATGAGSNDVSVRTFAADELAELDAENSNYSSVTVTGPGANDVTATSVDGNQSAAPLLVDPAAGNVAQAAGSPTIDAGADNPANGALDLAGQPRTAFARTDIGAYELQPAPPAAPLPSLSGATLKPSKFRAAAKGATLRAPSLRPKTKRGKKPVGSLLTFTSDQIGDVRAYVFKKLSGRRSKSGKCGRPSRSNASGKRCAYYKRLGGFVSTRASQGKNSYYFTGRWSKKKLKQGKYVLIAKHLTRSPLAPTTVAIEPGAIKRAFSVLK